MLKNLFAALIAATSMMALANPAAAETSPRADSVIVRYADLDLNTSRGADRLLMRVQRAAGDVCGRNAGLKTLAMRRAVSRCVDETVSAAVVRINHPDVSARYIERYAPATPILQAGETARAG